MSTRLMCKIASRELFGNDGKLLKEAMWNITVPEFKIFNSKFAGKPEDKFETMLFLPVGEGTQREGGLRKRGCLKFSYRLKKDCLWYTF
ncbi:MAG: hypothetical protein RMJ18_03205 [Candidatus Aenigmarchaeota archaeon]|nr:hypothetical protein [Candidatus Aenigmarchaeota archaeon]MDW8160396.1 hypothetical protein [Candidatus Aenigmarchaeota archaeon]